MNFIEKYKNLIENFISLYLLKIANILIPLVTLPYLVRVLGVENFGLISFAQVFAGFFVVFVDFGFYLSSIRLISIDSDNIKKVSEIFSSIIVIKIILLIISFIVYSIIIISIEKFNQNYWLYFMMFGIVIGQGLFPSWLFQGMQKMRYITILNIIVKVIFLILILVSIKSPEDILYYPILLTFGYIGILPFAFYLIHKNFGISFFIPDVKKLLYYFRYSSHFFISRVAMQFYTNGGLFVVGLISPELVVGYYAIADKLRYAITALYDPIAQVLYPYIAKAKNIMLYKKLFVIINLLNIMGLAILYFFTKDIMIFIFGECAQMTVTILHIFILVMILDIPSILFGYPLLGALGYTHFANYSLVVAAVVFIVALAILYALGMLTAQSVAWLYVFSIVIELSLRIWAIRKYKLLAAS